MKQPSFNRLRMQISEGIVLRINFVLKKNSITVLGKGVLIYTEQTKKQEKYIKPQENQDTILQPKTAISMTKYVTFLKTK